MSIALLFFCLTVFVMISVAVVLLVWIGVGGCEWPSSMMICLIILAFFALTNTPAISASAAEEITCCRIEHSTTMGPFNCASAVGGLLGLESGVLKK